MLKKIILAITIVCTFLTIIVSVAKPTFAAVDEGAPISVVNIYSQNSFSYTKTFTPTVEIVDLNQLMKEVFTQGGHANWQYNVQIEFSDSIANNSFRAILSGIDTNQLQEVDIEGSDTTVFTENIPSVYNKNNISMQYIDYILITATGTQLVNLTVTVGNSGYNQGYIDGYLKGEEDGLNDGYSNGFSDGENFGYDNGYDIGYEEGAESANENSLYNMILAVVDAPFQIFDRIFDFNVLGINIKNVVLSFASVAIVIFVIKRFI